MDINVLCSSLKLMYYVLLILYHSLDFVMDWYNFHVLLTDDTISGVPADGAVAKVFFGLSCVCCTICSAILLKIYVLYIKYHYRSIYIAAFVDHGPVRPDVMSASIQWSDHEDRQNVPLFIDRSWIGSNSINPKYILAELFISVAELTLKDDIQSGLLFWISTECKFTRALSWYSLLFSICSVLAHLKLFICFVTKLFRLGESDDVASDRSRWDLKCCLCVFGCIGSASFEGLTITYLSSDKPTPIPRSLTLDTATLETSKKPSDHNKERRYSTPLEETAGLSRSCDFLDIDDPHDNYVTDMHLIVLKDILRCWRTMLRKPTIDLAGACWEDFEMVESESWPKITEDKSSISVPVCLRRLSPNSDTNNCCRQYIAKIKCQYQANSSAKSLFDHDYSVCSSVESHENVSRVLAYFRGDIRSTILGLGDDISPLHTTISVSDQVPVQTCAEFVSQSKDTHSKDPLSYERTVCMLMLQCLKGVTHLHDSGFTHGNLNLNNLFLIKHDNDCQLFIANFGKSQPLAKDRRASNLCTKSDDSSKQSSSLQSDLTAISEIMTAMLHQDQNGNGTHSSKVGHSTLPGHLRQASERLRDGSASLHHVVRFLQALLWGPFKLGENIVIVSESRMKQWLERQRGEFIARLAMDEALARTVGGNSRKFSMEDLLLCEYLTVATPSALVRTEKRWFLAT